MLPKDRHSKILKLLEDQHTTNVRELSKIFNVSIPTLYKDLDILEKEKRIQKSYGQISLILEEKYRHHFFSRLKVNKEKKRYIARSAVSFIQSGDTIFLDSSTTTFYLCDEIRRSNLQNLTLVTNSLFIPQEFIMYPNVRVILLGGLLDSELGCFHDPEFEPTLSRIQGNRFFFSAQAISGDKGILDVYHPDEIKVKQLFYANAAESVALMDSTKFAKSGTVNWLGIEGLKFLITDRDLDGNIQKHLREKGVRVFT